MTGGLDPIDEAQIIRRCREHDAEAFRWLIRRYQSRIYNFARRMLTSADEAEDVTQEVFLKAFKNIRSYDGRAAVSTWLFKIASNLCVDRARRRKRRSEAVSLDAGPESALLEPTDSTWDPESHAVATDMRAALDVAIASLSEKLRPVLLLHDVEGMDYKQIADSLGIPLGTVKSRLFLARGHLQAALEPYLSGGTE